MGRVPLLHSWVIRAGETLEETLILDFLDLKHKTEHHG